jgi:Tol biopolymer transport system component
VDRAKYGNKYIWPLYNTYDIFMADTNGNVLKKLTTAKGYDAEATLSYDGKKMIYCSDKDGDLDLYVMDIASGKEKKVTNSLGYDGGAWFSPDGKKIVWRASRPKTEAEIAEYSSLLKEGLVAPTNMEVFVANADGSDAKQITQLGQANWAPNFTPDGKQIIFCSNHEYKRGFPFNMYLINLDGSGLVKISRDKGFDAFPMFSPDGKKIIFASNRNNKGTRDTNLFVADWVY